MDFRILGPVEVWNNGEEIPLDGSKQRTVLAALLLAGGRMLSDSHLCALLWGENPPATFNAQLYTYVSRLRKYLGDGVNIVRRRPGYLIRIKPGELDSEEFDRLSRAGREALRLGRYAEAARQLGAALELWRGPALANVTEFLADTQSYRLEEARMVALECRIEADLALGRHVQLLSELTGLVAERPLHEGLRIQLMRALCDSDRQADALGVYQDGRRVLAEELGIDPGRALSEAYRAILSGGSTGLVPAQRRHEVVALGR
ncbi:AfsR/SARP family transcriptional regulator [Longispora albida]|uniref:AfsR/SARP family transcriptional regulator n=1 Tax=Longispora albida TaxID=203523 RepID=UPI00039C073F|nr:AfsR/SARP family transcriptional regulator [Longispora albida]